jgi:hypothetical protein
VRDNPIALGWLDADFASGPGRQLLAATATTSTTGVAGSRAARSAPAVVAAT